MGEHRDDQGPLQDGRYEGSNGDFLIDVRIDVGESGVISADLFRAGGPGHEHVASVRTEPGITVEQPDGTWGAFFQAYDDTTAPGEITVRPVPDDAGAATVTFRSQRALNVLPAGVEVVAVVQWKSAQFRRLGLEVETEEGVDVPESYVVNDRKVVFTDLLERAGFQVRPVGQPSLIQPNDDGWRWDESVVYGVLDDLMNRTAQASLRLPAWKLHLLRLGRPRKDGLYGVMFDLAERLPRQGCAVFVGEILEQIPEERRQQRILHTMAHEVGHAFNLAHRFETVVGRPHSTSVMNYPDAYLDGEDKYWRRCGFGFDADELAFLRHGPRSAVMPGAAPFHAVDYWSATSGHHPEVLPALPSRGFDLWLEPPGNNGVFAFGQPIFLQVNLKNTGAQPVPLPRDVLDLKAGYLEIRIERVSAAGATRSDGGRPFVPMMRRCFALAIDRTPGAQPRLPVGASLNENVNLSFGSGGFAMAEPGEYYLTPVLTREPGGPVIRGRSLRVWIDDPADRAAEKQGIRLLQSDVGTWFALGGSHVLAKAYDEVNDVLEERTSGKRRSSGVDPVVASIKRSLGIHASRTYLRLENGRFAPRAAATTVAVDELGDVLADPNRGRYFDASTIESTQELLRRNLPPAPAPGGLKPPGR